MKATGKILAWIVIAITTVASGRSVSAQEDKSPIVLADNLKITPADEGIFRIVHSLPWPANSLLVRVSEDQFVLVDTPWDISATKFVVQWFNKKYDGARLLAINTHFHRDCLGGNSYLIENDIPVYGADLTVSLLASIGIERDRNSSREFRAEGKADLADAYEASPLVAPTHTFPLEEGLKMTFEDETVDVFFPGPGHTKDNIVVYFRRRKLLFGGCLLKSMRQKGAGFTGDADLASWSQSIDRLRQRFPDAETVIPGHGAWGTLRILTHTQEIVTTHISNRK
jgi:glyoxylase-like metal-dependent hydrolase (beta-lactamase superfamily II)